jgi:hypothetical protein
MPATPSPPLANAYEDIVQIAEPVYDVITGQTVTNGIYLIDDGALLPTMSLSLNAGSPEGYSRPNAFELTTVTPPEWSDAFLGLKSLLSLPRPGLSTFYPDTFSSFLERVFEISEYGAQIGHNPADPSTDRSVRWLDTELVTFDYLDFFQVNLPDPTNDPARIEITRATWT